MRGSYATWHRSLPPASARRLSLLVLSAAVLFGDGSISYARETLPALTTVAAVRRLSPAEADRGYPVRLRAVVTYFDPRSRYLVVQDATGGIYVQIEAPDLPLARGQLVQVEGMSTPGVYSRSVAKAKLKSAGAAPMPAPRSTSLGQLATGSEDCQWVEARGVVRAAVRETSWVVLHLFANQTELRILVNVPSPGDLARLVGGRVKVVGVCGTLTNPRGELKMVQLLVSRLDDLTVEEAASGEPEALPLTPAGQVGKLSDRGDRRVRVEGNAVRVENQLLEVRDETGTCLVRSDELLQVRVGDRVMVLAFPGGSAAVPALVHGIVQVLAPRAAAANRDPSQVSRQDILPLLQQVRAVRGLSTRQADLGYPVRVRGVVTYCEPLWKSLFIQDATAGIFVAALEKEPNVRTGQIVEVIGFSERGDFAPIIRAAQVVTEAQGELPQAHEAPFADLASGKEDSQWVAVAGVVRAAARRAPHLVIDIEASGGSFTALVAGDDDSAAGERLIDSEVRIRGACGTIFNRRRQSVGMRLFTPGVEYVQVTQPGPEDPFALPGRKITELLGFNPEEKPGHRVKTAGVVTWCHGTLLFLRDETGGMGADLRQPLLLQPGDEVEAVGFPGVEDRAPRLQGVVVRKLREGPPPEPTLLSITEALRGDCNADLVRLEAWLVDSSSLEESHVLLLQADGRTFEAHLLGDAGSGIDLEPGCLLRVTGIGAVQFDKKLAARSFRLLLRGKDDLVVVKRPPWWTVRRVLTLLGVVGAVALAALGWVVSLRRRVRGQTTIIRDRLRHEANLEGRYRDLVQSANDIIYTHDLDGNLLAWNPAGERILGYSEREIRQMNISQLLPADQLPLARKMIAHKVKQARKTVYELQVLAQDGRRVTVEISSQLRCRPDEPDCIEGIARDVNERKQLEEELRQAQKMEAVGTLAGGVAHDFNNLLTVINGYSEMLLAEISTASPIRDRVREILKSGERAAALTRQLLAFGRKQVLAAKVLDLNTIIRDLDQLLRRLIGENIDLRTALDPTLGRVKADPSQIEQVLINLAVNARDAMPTGGLLTIETRNAALEGAAIASPHVLVLIRDSGCGMDRQTQERVFEPFFTTKEMGKGTGMGLATVYGIVKQSGGHIEIESELGRGTTFRIYLPALPGVGGSDGGKAGGDLLPRGVETALVVEDKDLEG